MSCKEATANNKTTTLYKKKKKKKKKKDNNMVALPRSSSSSSSFLILILVSNSTPACAFRPLFPSPLHLPRLHGTRLHFHLAAAEILARGAVHSLLLPNALPSMLAFVGQLGSFCVISSVPRRSRSAMTAVSNLNFNR
jgi:hypothetical protein